MTKPRLNYEDYASGRVLYGVAGATNFSVRLSNEIFQWCEGYFTSKDKPNPYIIWDPFCGIAYTVTVLGFLHGSKIKTIFASDINQKMVEFAQKNLSLLTHQGMDSRIQELQTFIDTYHKKSHSDALRSALCLKAKTAQVHDSLVFHYDIFSNLDLPKEINKVNLVFADVPYGNLTQWEGLRESQNPIQIFLDKIKDKLDEVALVVVVSNKKQNVVHQGYKKVKEFKCGARKITILEVLA